MSADKKVRVIDGVRVKVVSENIKDDGSGFILLTADGVEYDSMRNVRSDLALGIARDWVGKPTSNIGHQYLDLKNGMIVAGRYLFERRDLLCIQGERINVFVDPDGSISVQPWGGDDEASNAAKKRARAVAKFMYEYEAEFFAHERKFFAARPWERCNGVTPEEAVRILTPYVMGASPLLVRAQVVTHPATDDLNEGSYPVTLTPDDAEHLVRIFELGVNVPAGEEQVVHVRLTCEYFDKEQEDAS